MSKASAHHVSVISGVCFLSLFHNDNCNENRQKDTCSQTDTLIRRRILVSYLTSETHVFHKSVFKSEERCANIHSVMFLFSALCQCGGSALTLTASPTLSKFTSPDYPTTGYTEYVHLRYKITREPHDKTNKMTYASSEDSVQPGYPPSQIRVFDVRMKKAWVLSYPLSEQRRL